MSVLFYLNLALAAAVNRVAFHAFQERCTIAHFTKLWGFCSETNFRSTQFFAQISHALETKLKF